MDICGNLKSAEFVFVSLRAKERFRESKRAVGSKKLEMQSSKCKVMESLRDNIKEL